MDWRHLRFLLVGVLGCAAAGESVSIDATIPVTIDAPPTIDALITSTLSQTSDTNVVGGKTVACGVISAGYTVENSWYRVFKLADSQVDSPFHITGVQVGIEKATANQAVQLKLGTYSGAVGDTTLDTALITPLQAKTLSITNAVVNALIDTPIETVVPAGSNLIVELFAPDGMAAVKEFRAGSTAAAETSFGYVRAPGCANIVMPTSQKTVAAGAGSLVITVTGTHY